MKKRFLKMLNKTNRDTSSLLKYLESNGFYTAPCSTQYHLPKAGGLLEHSVNVANLMLEINKIKEFNLNEESVTFVGLLHDIGKIGQFNKPFYIENTLKSGKKSTIKPYKTNADLLYIPHEIRSIEILSSLIEITEEENHAILMHNGMYSDLKYSLKGKETPLQMLLHFADMWCSRIIETNDEQKQPDSIEDAAEFPIKFGKYKDKKLEDVYRQDKNYFSWLEENAKDPCLIKACEILTKAQEVQK